MPESKRIVFNEASSSGNSLMNFVVTGSPDEPVVCLADNAHFPQVQALYAKHERINGKDGVMVSVFFDGPATGSGLAVNIMQPNMNGDFTVIPQQ